MPSDDGSKISGAGFAELTSRLTNELEVALSNIAYSEIAQYSNLAIDTISVKMGAKTTNENLGPERDHYPLADDGWQFALNYKPKQGSVSRIDQQPLFWIQALVNQLPVIDLAGAGKHYASLLSDAHIHTVGDLAAVDLDYISNNFKKNQRKKIYNLQVYALAIQSFPLLELPTFSKDVDLYSLVPFDEEKWNQTFTGSWNSRLDQKKFIAFLNLLDAYLDNSAMKKLHLSTIVSTFENTST